MSTMSEALEQAKQQADTTTAQLEHSIEELGKSVERVLKENEALRDELTRARADLTSAANVDRQLRDELEQVTNVLRRNGFRACDIAACNCGSWHAGPNLRAEKAEAQVKELEAGRAFALDRLAEVTRLHDDLAIRSEAERDALKAELATVTENQQRQWTEKDHYRTRAVEAEAKLLALKAELQRRDAPVCLCSERLMVEVDTLRAQVERLTAALTADECAWNRLEEVLRQNLDNKYGRVEMFDLADILRRRAEALKEKTP